VLSRDALLAYAHFIAIFALASLLAGELFVLRETLTVAMLRRLRGMDRWYGIVAGLVILTGLGRLFFGLKGPAFYAGNAVFWTKMMLFVVVALLSVVPTVILLRSPADGAPDTLVVFENARYERLRTFLWAQVAVFLFIPLCAAFMARGL
jgi:putative membrane protein